MRSLLLMVLALDMCYMHHNWTGFPMLTSDLANTPGVMVSFEHPIYSNGYFLGFRSWAQVNRKYNAINETFIVRLEFRQAGLRDSRVRRHHRRFFLPGVKWIEMNERVRVTHFVNLTVARTKNETFVDLWVIPECFLRHSGVSRIHRVAKSLKVQVDFVRWIAKLNFAPEEKYTVNELVEIGKVLAKVPGIESTWIHPDIESRFSIMLKFFRGEVPRKKFFSPTQGYTNWKSLNNQYQVKTIHYVRGYSRALLDFRGGISFSEGQTKIAKRYESLPGVSSVYMDTFNDCRFTYEIVLAFDHKMMNRSTMRNYNHWNALNLVYGVIDLAHDVEDDGQLRAFLEFEAGLYSHRQMTAIKDEYLKLPGIKFGWVTGKPASEVTTLILDFDRTYLMRVPLRKYKFWDALNKKYKTNVTLLDAGHSKALIRLPQGKFRDRELKSLLSKYRHLPGVKSVRMDVDIRPPYNPMNEAGRRLPHLLLPPKRGLDSWMRLSNLPQSLIHEPMKPPKTKDPRHKRIMHQCDPE